MNIVCFLFFLSFSMISVLVVFVMVVELVLRLTTSMTFFCGGFLPACHPDSWPPVGLRLGD